MRDRDENGRVRIQRGKISFVLSVLLVASFFGGGVAQANDANNWGYLKIDVRLEGKQLNNSCGIVKDDLYYPNASDGLDQYDNETILFDPDESGGFVDIENKKITSEFSQNSSRTAKHVKGFYNGTIASGSEPNIIVELSWEYAEPTEGRFGDMPLIATKETPDGNNIEEGGYRGDIRAEMDYSGPDFASIDFGELPAGTYTPDTPFLHLRVDFDKPLGDLDNDNVVNLKDYAIIAKRWREEERSIADISGPNDVPDRTVDYYDLGELVGSWLEGG